MAQVIELFGAPGAGKSSLVRALDGRRVDGLRFVAAQRLTRVRRRGPLGRLFQRELTPGERRAALVARSVDWSSLLALIAASPRGAPDPLRALHAPGWMATTLELRALADAAPEDVVVLLDEGLIQRAPIVLGPDVATEQLERYVSLLPPALQLHLVADATRLAARLRGRNRIIDRHVGLDDAALAASLDADVCFLARCAKALDALGATVHTIPTDGALHAAVAEIVALVRCSRRTDQDA